MARQRLIVGVGEALLAESADGDKPAGIALLVPIHAVRLGHVGVAVSRLGQDPTATVLLSQLRGLGVDVDYLQSDPDLATGRLSLRTFGGENRGDNHAAFDNLQWDFDLADVAQRADAVVFGVLTRRSGQTRSATDRFLAECTRSLRVFDLTNHHEAELNRTNAMSGLGHCEVVVVNDSVLEQLLPGTTDDDPRNVILELMRRYELSAVLDTQEGRPLVAHTIDSAWSGNTAHQRHLHEATIVGFMHGVLGGWEMQACVDLGERFGAHVRDRPDQPPPPELLEPS